MKQIGIVGLGNMGMGMAANLVAAGFSVVGFDLSEARLHQFIRLGGRASADIRGVGASSDIVFVMVVNARQATDVICGKGGLLEVMKPDAVVIVTATIGRPAVREIDAQAKAHGVFLLDSPVSGGRVGAETGGLTLMLSGDQRAYDTSREAFEAVGKNITYLGEEVGLGQVMKACLQGLVGCYYVGMFEVLALGVKAGLTAESLFEVLGASVVNTALFQNSVPSVIARKFAGSGSTVYNTYKDLTITMALAQEAGVPMMATAVATQFFQAANTKFPQEDNESLIKLLEHVTGVEVAKAPVE
jgi:L-threonate 2-dehydrogenase